MLAGIAMTPLPTEEDASICAPSVTLGIKPDDPHYPRTRLLCLANTVGGKVLALERRSAASDAAHGRAGCAP